MRPPLGPIDFVRRFWRHRDLVWQMTERDAHARYRGSSGGLFWTAFHPVLMLVVYTFFFSEVFPTRWSTTAGGRGEFALVLFVGLLLQGLLAETMQRAPTLVVGNPNLVKKVVFPLDLLPVVSLGTTVFHFAIGLAIWLVFHLAIRGAPPPAALLLPLVVLPLVVMALGIAWWLASLGVFVRDVNHVVPVLSTVLLFASPIFYPLDAMKGAMRTIVLASPLTVPVEQSRRVLIDGLPPDWGALGAYALVALVVAMLGLAWFQGTRKGFADVV
ncbi:MAG TPA: ABC transporter permease [Casimicrobiaceae bacterium]|nr:ABC transporter permease [Casimicrobiaceae bacterium]